MLSLPGLLVLFALLPGSHTGATTAPGQAASQPAGCAEAAAALERGELEQAREKYLGALATAGSESCAAEGLRTIVRTNRAEARLCAEAKVLAATGEDAAARRRYTAALRLDAGSECAKTGLSPAKKPETDSEKNSLEKASDAAANALKLVGSVAVALFVALGFILTLILLVRRRKASLTVEPFTDGGVEPKVGATVAALVEKHLTELSRGGRRADDSYLLDVVVADVELLATNKGLETALGGLAEASQFTLVVAVLGLADRMYGTHLVAKGELAPKGGDGHGVVLALQSEKNGMQARGALWKDSRVGPKNPKPYYELAEPAAAWVQYETARSLDSRVGLITTSARSFSLLSLGLAEQRARREVAAAEKYAEALGVDPENVAAMFNLGGILMTDEGWFWKGFLLLIRALTILETRYEELE